MVEKLTKPWGPHAAGTFITTRRDWTEVKVPQGATVQRVNEIRMERLRAEGYFEREERGEARRSRSRPIQGGPDKGGHNDGPPVTPRPNSTPVGQGAPLVNEFSKDDILDSIAKAMERAEGKLAEPDEAPKEEV